MYGSHIHSTLPSQTLWALLKLIRGAEWSFVDLSHPQNVVKKFWDLHDIRLGAMQS